MERLVNIGDCELFISETGQGFPVIILHGGPGMDHHAFGQYLHPLADAHRLIFVDERASGRSSRPDPSTWTLERMAADVHDLAQALGLEDFAVLGHSYGAFVALQYAVDFPGDRGPVIISAGLPSSRFLDAVEDELATFEPVELREQVAASWERERSVATAADFAELMHDQLPFHFRDPRDPRIAEFEYQSRDAVYSPEVLRAFADAGYGGIEVEDRLGTIDRPVLVLAGRHDRTCSVAGAQAIADGVPGSRLVVFENSAHMMYVEEPELYRRTVREFLADQG